MPYLPHTGFKRRLLLYLWFSALSIVPTVAYARGCDYVWAFCQRVFSTYTALAAKILWRTRVVSDVTDIWPEALVNTSYARDNSIVVKIGRLVAEIAYRSSDTITTISDNMVQIFKTQYGVPDKKIQLLPLVGSSITNLKSHAFRPPFVILYYGNLGANYDLDVIFETAQLLKEEKNVLFEILGIGEKLQEVTTKTKQMKLPNLLLHGYTVNQEKLAEVVANVDALILPMKPQNYPDVSFPTKLVEYFSFGKPVIFLGEGYPFRLVEQNNVGLAASPGDSKAVALFIQKILKDTESTKLMGSNGKALAANDFSTEKFEGALLQVFR